MATGYVAYNHGLVEAFKGNVNWETDTIKAMLLDVNHTLNPDHDFVADIVANEVSDPSYSRVTLTNRSLQVDDTNDQGEGHADNPVWQNLDVVTIDYVAFYKEVTDDTDSILLFSVGVPQTTAEGKDYELKVAADGIFTIKDNV